jgi:DMSO/TMAO reductase YedYZ molybdopterin-dependent catalytic subunit
VVVTTKVRRAGRRTNLALLVLLPIAFATGWLAFGTGTVWPARIVTIGHAVVGIAVLALVPWKQLIVRRGLARPRLTRPRLARPRLARPRLARPRLARRPGRVGGVFVTVSSIGLAVFVVLSLAAGFAQSYAGPHTYLGFTAMQVHVGAAVAAAPLFVVHLITRPQRVRATDLSRRNVLRFGALVGVGAVVFAAADGLAVAARLPGRLRRATGSYETGTDDPAAMPLTSWLFDKIPAIDPTTYSVSVRAGDGTRAVGYDELVAWTDEVRAILDCTGGWYAAQTWRGVRIDRLIPAIPHGQVNVVTSATGYARRFPAAEASSLWLATHLADAPLDAGHGGPARLVAPGRRGFWWVKWVASIETESGPDWWQSPFPLH